MRNLYYEQLQKESDGTYEKEIRADERRKILHEQRALDVNLQISAEELRADERKKFAIWLDKKGYMRKMDLNISRVEEALYEYEKENKNV